MRLPVQPLEGTDLLHWVGSALEGLGFGFQVALMIGVNTHRSAIMRPSPSRTIAMAASCLSF